MSFNYNNFLQIHFCNCHGLTAVSAQNCGMEKNESQNKLLVKNVSQLTTFLQLQMALTRSLHSKVWL